MLKERAGEMWVVRQLNSLQARQVFQVGQPIVGYGRIVEIEVPQLSQTPKVLQAGARNGVPPQDQHSQIGQVLEVFEPCVSDATPAQVQQLQVTQTCEVDQIRI